MRRPRSLTECRICGVPCENWPKNADSDLCLICWQLKRSLLALAHGESGQQLPLPRIEQLWREVCQ